MLKDFIADIAKKPPIPNEFSTKGLIRKTLILHYTCGHGGGQCRFPADRAFTTETKAWSKWLKVAFSAVTLGKAGLVPAGPEEALGHLKDIWSSYSEKDADSDFLAYIREPFLTSEEQDALVKQLRAAKFFNDFNYDARSARWGCTMCVQPQAA